MGIRKASICPSHRAFVCRFASMAERDLRDGQHRNVSGRIDYFTTVIIYLPIWSSISTSAIPFANINDAYNSGATPYGQIFNSAIHEYALGYGSTPNVNGTAVLKWNTSGNVTVAGTFGMKGYTVGTLPAGVTGAWAYVTDASGPTYGATVVGGGSVVTPVFYNGSNWTCR